MVPWVAAARRLEADDASGSGASESRSWVAEVVQAVEDSVPQTPEKKALAGAVMVLLVATIA
jgi:hypothetical protein